jgi:hypothetical protein
VLSATLRTLCKEFLEQERENKGPLEGMTSFEKIPCVFFYPTVPMYHLEKYSIAENWKTQDAHVG